MRATARPGHRTGHLARGIGALVAGAAIAVVPVAGATAAPSTESNTDRPTLSASGAERMAPLHEQAGAIDGRYIVVLKDGAGASRATADLTTSVTRAGGTVHEQYANAIDGFTATMDANTLSAVRSDPAVDFVEADSTISIAATQSPATWGLDRTDQRNLPLDNAWSYNATGSGVTAYIIDTGIRNSHTEFGGRAVSGYDAIGDGYGTDDCNGHGTHVAGTVGGSTYGIAKNVGLVAVRVLDCGGSGSISGVVAGVDWVTGNHSGPSVANMSLGGGYSPALDASVDGSISSGVTYAVAAGNSYGADACQTSPSGVPAAITVASSTSNDSVSGFSNLGSCIDIFGPGSDITSAWPTSDTATNTISGTSMATPHVAGVAALVLEGSPGASPADVGAAITSNGTSGVLSGVPGNTVNLLLFSNW